MVKEMRETVYLVECIHTVFLHCSCSSVDSSLSEALRSFFRSLAPDCMYIAMFHYGSVSDR